MPGPGKMRKPKANAKGVRATSKQTEPTPAQCLALEEDKITRCGQPRFLRSSSLLWFLEVPSFLGDFLAPFFVGATPTLFSAVLSNFTPVTQWPCPLRTCQDQETSAKLKQPRMRNPEEIRKKLVVMFRLLLPPHAQSPSHFSLEEDKIIRCGQLAIEGYPKPDRCKVHHGQYHTLYKKYKGASKVVDQIKDGAALPTEEQLGHFQDWKAVLDKARWVRKYLEAIRVEKAGREIHQKRRFLKGKCRQQVVDCVDICRYIFSGRWSQAPQKATREVVGTVDVLDSLQRRAYELYQPEGGLHAMNDQASSTAEVELKKRSSWTTEELLECIRNPDAFDESFRLLPSHSAGHGGGG